MRTTVCILLCMLSCKDQRTPSPSTDGTEPTDVSITTSTKPSDTQDTEDTGEPAPPPLTLVAPGQPVPCILAADGAYDHDAAAELADYLSRVTGQVIEVMDEPSDEGVILHVGSTDFVESQVDLSGIYADGFVVRHLETDGRDHLVLAGRVELASQWAVEHFLREVAGVRWLFPDPTYGEHVPTTETLTVPIGVNTTHEPDYAHRGSLSMYYFNSTATTLRNFANGSGVYGQHALQTIFDGDDYAAHPEWFAWFDGARQWWSFGNGWQICTANEDTVTHAVEHCTAYFEANPDADTCSIGANDGNGLCTDELCNALRHAPDEPYTDSEMWWLWVNAVATQLAEVDDGAYSDRWVESLAYAWTSYLPRFALEPNVAITKTIVLDDEIDQAEAWAQAPSHAQSINLYSYPMCSSFLGFRHYPSAMADFLLWGRDTLGARAHVPECGPADWAFDAPKYAYTQALQWDADADPTKIMDDFCAASYGAAAKPLCDFWHGLEDVWESREASTEYGDENTRLLFYQWVGWQVDSYVPPNDELRAYTQDDVDLLDALMAEGVATAAADSEVVQYRVARLEDAWGAYRTYILSKLDYLDASPEVTVDSEARLTEVRALADEIAMLRADRTEYRARLSSHPAMNVRSADSSHGKLGWLEGYTLFSYEQGLADRACSAISDYLEATTSADAAVDYWNEVEADDPLYVHAQSQLYVLQTGAAELLHNGDFEMGSLAAWDTEGVVTVTDVSGPHDGSWSAALQPGFSALSQSVQVSQQARYRLTVWGQYSSDPDDFYVPTEAQVRFYDSGGSLLIDHDPTRSMFQTTRAKEGWTRIVSTMTAPYTAVTATVTLLKHHDAEMWLDDVSFERIMPGPHVEEGVLYDHFDGETLDWEIWYPASGASGTSAPTVTDSELVYDSEDSYPINSLATFDELLDYTREDAYTLKLHLRLLDGGDPESMTSFGIKTGTGPLSINESGFMFYHYWSDAASGDVGRLNAYSYQDSSNVQTWVATRDAAWSEVYYTFVFEPDTLTVYAATDGYTRRPSDQFMSFEHNVHDIDDHGSVCVKLDSGTHHAVDEISLEASP